MRFDPRLDAYRGVCITLVFLQHWEVLRCGWIGVQAFFVLSGYLITNILRTERESVPRGGYFVNFYARRVLRIFPLYFAYVFLLFLLADVFKTDFTRGFDRHFNPSLPFLLTFTQNLYRIYSGISSPFYSHLWSLSVEEQFYLVWPLVVYLVPPRRFLMFCLLVIAAGLAVRWGMVLFLLQLGLADVKQSGIFIYYFTGSHIDAFAFGALLTCRHESVHLKRAMPLVSRWVPLVFAATTLWMLLLGGIAHYGIGLNTLGWPSYLPYFHAYVWGFTLLNALFFVVLANMDRLRALADRGALQRVRKVSFG